MRKHAYPQSEHTLSIESPHNLNKWMKSMQEMYVKAVHMDLPSAFNQVTSGWDNMEKIDFKNWMSFYQEDAHNKYKTAQLASSVYIENGGSFIPNIDHLKAKLPSREPDMSGFMVSHDVQNNQDREAQKIWVERKIRSLISRLNAAEKIATDPQVQLALKKSLYMSVDEWVTLLQKLKREIQLAPMRVTSASLIEDIVYKHANQAYAAGNKTAASLLIKIAQVGDVAVTPTAPAAPTAPPTASGQLPIPAEPSGMSPVENTEPAVPVQNDKDAVAEFLNNLNNADILEVNYVEDGESIDDEAEIVVTAQAALPPPQPSPNPAQLTPSVQSTPSKTDGNLEVSEDEIANRSQTGIEDAFDQALSNVKIKDIVTRLEGIASMFKNRQIARQLSIIDLMMDSVGIAPFFPGLGEAMKSALESNQYCQTRVEEILAKLRGTISTPMSQHMEGEMSGENDLKEDQIKSQLAQQEESEDVRKQRRKMLQEKEEDAALAPQPSPGQELAGPAQVQKSPPLRPAG